MADTAAPGRTRSRPRLLALYRTTVGKKQAMALSGIVLMAYVLVHMIGNLKLYQGAEEMDAYAAWLREIAYPAMPEESVLWIMRVVLLAAVVIHIHAAASLTLANRRARPERYRSRRDYVAADFAGRTMRWTGIIVLLFIAFHVADLTLGTANPDFTYGEVHANVVASFERAPVAAFYVLANLALGLHLYHGGWSLFQSMGWTPAVRRGLDPRRAFAVAFAVVVVAGNVSFPVAVQLGVVG